MHMLGIVSECFTALQNFHLMTGHVCQHSVTSRFEVRPEFANLVDTKVPWVICRGNGCRPEELALFHLVRSAVGPRTPGQCIREM